MHSINELETQAERFPESFRVQVLRKLEQARKGVETGLDMAGVLEALAKRVEEIKARCGIEDKASRPETETAKVFSTPFGSMSISEVMGEVIVEVAGVRFTEREIDIVHANKPGRDSLGLILNAKRIFEGMVVSKVARNGSGRNTP